MAIKNQQPETTDSTALQLFTIEELQKKKNMPSPIFGGVCTALEWKPGKMVTEKDFDSAVEKFSDSPIGKKVK